MNPRHVNAGNFERQVIVFNDGYYSVATGIYKEDNTICAASRWNGAEGRLGFPNAHGHALWDIIAPALALDYLKSLIGKEGTLLHELLREIPRFAPPDSEDLAETDS